MKKFKILCELIEVNEKKNTDSSFIYGEIFDISKNNLRVVEEFETYLEAEEKFRKSETICGSFKGILTVEIYKIVRSYIEEGQEKYDILDFKFNDDYFLYFF